MTSTDFMSIVSFVQLVSSFVNQRADLISLIPTAAPRLSMNYENGSWASDNRILQLDAIFAHTLEHKGYSKLERSLEH